MLRTINHISLYSLLLMALGSSLFFTSCEKFVDNGTPINAISQEKAFVDSSTATSVVLGLYSLSATSTFVLLNNRYGSMSADDGYNLSNSTYDNFKNNTLVASNEASTIWNNAYIVIGRANYAIEGLTAATGLTATAKNQLLGEAKFWRAYCYFYLVNYFSDVPLVTSTDALKTSQFPRTPAAQVYEQIVKDLTDAKGLLTTSYPSADRARINKRVASSLLARVYLFLDNKAGAEAEATEVIGSGVYGIETNLANAFIKTSNEIIWQIANINGVTGMGVEFIPPSTTPTMVLYDTLANTFEAGDLRKDNWTKPIVYSAKTYYYPYKYKLRVGTGGNEYAVMLRLAELYLTRAEVRAGQSKLDEAVADLNVIRQRAGLSTFSVPSSLTKEQILAIIEHERWVELFTEGSDRWFNLKRLNRADAVLNLIKPQWKAHQKLYPIPSTELLANKNLRDNIGYY